MRKVSRAKRTSLKRISSGGVVLALVALFGLPTAAFAVPGPTIVTVAGGVVTANAATPQVNRITLGNSGATGSGGVSIKDTGPAGPGVDLQGLAPDCVEFSADEVRCDLDTINAIVVNANDLNDTVNILNNSLASITINGGAGNDTLNGGPVVDTLNGDAGNDILKGGAGGDNFNGGDDVDTVDYGASTTGLVVTMGNIDDNDGRDVSAAAGHQTEGDTVAADVENIEGSNQVDDITGGTANNIIRGGPGADVLRGGDGDDTLRGEGGADNMFGDAGTADIVSYSTESAKVTVTIDGAFNDGPPLEGDNVNVGIEIVVGGTGGDDLTGGGGNETLRGASGNDTLNGDDGTDTLEGGLGSDTVSYAGRVTPVNISLDGVANDGGGGENDNVSADIENALGGSGADTITGNGGVNRLNGGPGADDLFGTGGNDTLIGPGTDGASDQYNGGGAVDTASFAGLTAVTVTADGVADDGAPGDNDNVLTNVENLTGSDGNDSLTGNASRNTLNGGDGNDQLFGDVLAEVSNDTLNGGLGNDGLHGLGGNDAMNGGPGPALGSDNDAIDGGLGVDTVSYSTRTANLSLTVDNVATDGQGAEADNIQTDTEKITGGRGDDVIEGDGSRDTLTGGAGDDTLRGLGGNDTLSGNGGNDLITGGGGRDIVSGATGNDTLNTNDGLRDSVNCGAGNDTTNNDSVDTLSANCFP